LSGGEEAKSDFKPPPVDPSYLPIFYGEVQYRAIKLLGQGNFGRAYLVTNEKGKQLVIKTQFCPTREKLTEANQEALVLQQFKSEHLLEITDVFPEGAQELCLVINFCSGGTLADQVAQQNSVEEVVRMIKELSKGLAVLHAKGYIHRDIKPDNIFLADKETRKVVIGDMGLARKVDENTGFYASTFGHTLYKAPEIARSQFSWRSDMWAVGCVLLELLSHTTMMELYSNKRVVLGVMSPADLATLIDSLLPNIVGGSAWRLVHRLLALDLNERLTAQQVAQWDLQSSA
jgi:serine/threonine protein kinase